MTTLTHLLRNSASIWRNEVANTDIRTWFKACRKVIVEVAVVGPAAVCGDVVPLEKH